MPEKIKFEYPEKTLQKTEKIFGFENESSKEIIKNLSDNEEPGSFYRGVKIDDAFQALFGNLRLDANPPDEILGVRDNATLNLHDAIYFSRSSQTKKDQKFFCVIGFDPLPTATIKDSYLNKSTFRRITGPVIAREIILRFSGKKPGQPSKKIKYFSPREFFEWYKYNISN